MIKFINLTIFFLTDTYCFGDNSNCFEIVSNIEYYTRWILVCFFCFLSLLTFINSFKISSPLKQKKIQGLKALFFTFLFLTSSIVILLGKFLDNTVLKPLLKIRT